MKNYKFFDRSHAAFSESLKHRINQHFKDNNIKKTADSNMWIKSVTALMLYLLPFVSILIFQPSNLLINFLSFLLMGFGVSFIGTSVMHDSLHRTYSKKQKINTIMSFSTLILGIDATIWKVQHNVLHHSYTNIEGADEDIASRYVLRFSPDQPLRWFHKFQHIYAIFFYALFTLVRVTVGDFFKAFEYQKLGLLKSKKSFSFFIFTIFLKKLIYFAIIIGLPIILLPISTAWILTFFLVMHLTAGIILSLIFQPAHVMESSEFFESNDHEYKENWLVHQLKTTSNFGTGSKALTWFSGSLNHQVEHHLFPNICHIHYPELSKIVKETTLEFGHPYHSQPSFAIAIYKHFSMLKQLGKK